MRSHTLGRSSSSASRLGRGPLAPAGHLETVRRLMIEIATVRRWAIKIAGDSSIVPLRAPEPTGAGRRKHELSGCPCLASSPSSFKRSSILDPRRAKMDTVKSARRAARPHLLCQSGHPSHRARSIPAGVASALTSFGALRRPRARGRPNPSRWRVGPQSGRNFAAARPKTERMPDDGRSPGDDCELSLGSFRNHRNKTLPRSGGPPRPRT